MSLKRSSGLCKSWGVIASFCWNDCMRVLYMRSFVNLSMNVRYIYIYLEKTTHRMLDGLLAVLKKKTMSYQEQKVNKFGFSSP